MCENYRRSPSAIAAPVLRELQTVVPGTVPIYRVLPGTVLYPYRVHFSAPNLILIHRCRPWDFCTAKYLRPSRGRKNNEICGKHFFLRQNTHTLCMGAIGFEHERVTTAELPNGPWGRSLAATPPPRVDRHRNQPIITSVGRCDAWVGHGGPA